MADKTHILPNIHTPGPKYMLPPLLGPFHHDVRRPTQPAFTIKGRRREEKVDPKATLQFDTVKITRFGNVEQGRVLPKLKGRQQEFTRQIIPGPSYDVAIADKLAFTEPPAYKLGARIKEDYTTDSPGPKYGLPTLIDGTGKAINIKSCPAYKILGRLPQKASHIGPSPLNYAAVPLEIYANRAPKPKMLGRLPEKIDRNPGPGPNTYDGMIRPIGKSGPMFSLGPKHNPRVGILRTDADLKTRNYLTCDSG